MATRGSRWAAIALIATLVSACQVARDPNAPRRLTDDVSISGQVKPADMKALRDEGFRTIVNMRPDGEAPDQTTYAQMQSATHDAGLAYGYVPVKSGAISRTAVEALGSTLSRMPKPVLLYSQAGDRPARTWALAEASKPGGLDAAAIEQAVKSAGQSADDLAQQITARIAARPKQ
jgi:uncharacterized protein (TIGR01244 family)